MKRNIFYIILILIFFNFLNINYINAQTANLGNTVISNTNVTLLIPLNFNSFTNIGSMDIRILFDNTKLSYTGIQNLSSAASGTMAYAVVVSGSTSRLSLSWVMPGSSGINFPNGKFLDIKFTYIGGNTSLTFDQPNCEVSNGMGSPVTVSYTNVNIFQNITLQSFNIGGGGSYCQGSAGTTVTLSGSQSGVNYQIKKNLVNYGSIKAGTGSTLTWNNLQSGSYTIKAYSGYDSLSMSGSATVSEISTSAVNIAINASQNPVISGTSVTYTATPTNGGTSPVYQWYVNNQSVGTNSASYSYTPLNNDIIKCSLTSNLQCTTNNPATSNNITMTVNQPLIASVDLGDSMLAEKNAYIYIPINFRNFSNVGNISLKLEYDSTLMSFILLDSLSLQSNGVQYYTTKNNTTIKTLNINWSAQSGNYLTTSSLRFLMLKFLFLKGETYLTFKTDSSYIKNSTDNAISVNYYNTKIKGNFKTLDLSLYLQSLFNINEMNPVQDENGNHFGSEIADIISVDLHNSNYPYTRVGSFTNQILAINGKCEVTIPLTYNSNYYIVIKHQNSIKTWSTLPVSFSLSIINYDFTNSISKAYGNNLIQIATGKYAIYTGDVNQDGLVDGSDMSDTEIENNNFTTGYVVTDVNGDGLVDGSDMSIVEIANNNFVSEIMPF